MEQGASVSDPFTKDLAHDAIPHIETLAVINECASDKEGGDERIDET